MNDQIKYEDEDELSYPSICHGAVVICAVVLSAGHTAMYYIFCKIFEKQINSLAVFLSLFVLWSILGFFREVIRVKFYKSVYHR